MILRNTMLILALCLVTIPVWAYEGCGPQRVAFSFDDAPTQDSAVMTHTERANRILQALKEGGVDEAAFFAVSSRIDNKNLPQIKAYARAGHVIASHSHTHANLHRVGTERFVKDINAADNILKSLSGFQPLFRFPYLNEGSTVKERDAVRSALLATGYVQGYVTIDNFDFYINNLYRQSVQDRKRVDVKGVELLYTDMILAAAEHYDALACKWLKRSPAHVLLLHENDAAALFLPSLIARFKRKGWTIITTTQAYQDPIAKIIPSTLMLGQGRVAAIASLAGAEESELRHEGESTERLDALYKPLVER